MTETRAACRSGVTHAASVACGVSARRLRPRAGSAGRSRDTQVNASREEVLRSDRPLVERDLIRVLVACGQGKPESAGRARKSSQRDPHRRCHANDACAWCRKGGNAPPSPVAHALSLRDTQGEFPPFVHAGSSVGRRFPSLRVRTVRKGAGPSDGVRLPTRSKPSKGVALVGMWTASESPSGGDDGSPETQRTPCPLPGCNRPGTYAAE
jgi:hypothetical protein